MDTGLDSPQVQALRKAFSKVVHDPERLRICVSGVLGAAGLFVLCNPESDRLAAARDRAASLETTAIEAEELRQLVQQSDTYVGRTPKVEDVGGWQDYVTAHLEAAGVTLRRIEPRKSLATGPFRVVVLEVTVDGMYPQLVDFMDRLERGERIARLDRIAFEKRAAAIGLRFQVLGLVKLRA